MMILPTVMKTSDDGMIFDKTLLSSNFVLKHLTSFLTESSNDERLNNVHNGVEKLSFNACKVSQDVVVGNDYTTWIDLFKEKTTTSNNAKLCGITGYEKEKKWNHSPLTTWADLQETVLSVDDKVEDESLSVQLAALRLQLEEKRRRFTEEKKRKQEEWREHRAKTLQNAFFHMLDNENEKVSDFWFARRENEVFKEPKHEPHTFKDGCIEKNKLLDRRDLGQTISSMDWESTRSFHDQHNFEVRKDECKNKLKLEEKVLSNKEMQPNVSPLSPDYLWSYDHERSDNVDYHCSINSDKLKSRSHPELFNVLNEFSKTGGEKDNSYMENVKQNTVIVDEGVEMLPFKSSFKTPEKRSQFAPQSESELILSNNSISESANNYEDFTHIGTEHEEDTERENNTENQDEIPREEIFVPQNTVHMDDDNDVSLMVSDEDSTAFQLSMSFQTYNPEENSCSREVGVIPEKDSDVLFENVAKLSSAMTFVIDMDTSGSTSQLTPQQIKKKERFLRQRQKNIDDEKKKKAAELEKKRMEKEEMTPKKTLKDEHSKNSCKGTYMKRLHNKLLSPAMTSPRRVPSPRNDPSPRSAPSPRSMHSELTSRTPCASPTSATHSVDESSRYAEYKGPDAYKKPSRRSNRKLMENAIIHYCLCGEVNKEAKKKCLAVIEKSKAKHFVVLFREGLKFRSVYEYNPENETATRLYGIGPKEINEKMIIKYFKYDSSGKEFCLLETKHLSIQVDGVIMISSYWKKIKQNQHLKQIQTVQ